MFALDGRERSQRRAGLRREPEDGRPPPLARELLDRVYRELAALAGLREEARYDIVTKRRFPPALETGIYFSLPKAGTQNEQISEALIAHFGLGVVERVPGFTFLCKACDGKGATEDGPCRACAGLGKQRPRFRSVRGGRNDYGLIGCDEAGLAFWGHSRRLPFNAATNKAKYMLFSSSRAGEPSIAGLPKYHIAGRQYPGDEVVISEGLLKAEIAAWKLRQRVIGLYSTAVDQATLAAVLRVVEEWRLCAS